MSKPIDFEFNATSDLNAKLSDYRGKQVILYFYPKDNTSGCTKESQDFTEKFAAFQKANAIIFGISRDSIKSHENFKAKYHMPFELISDPNEVLCKQFDVLKEKSMYGRKYIGIERSTFLINEKGEIAQKWRNVKVPGHVDEVLSCLAKC